MKLSDPMHEPIRYALTPSLIHDLRTPLNQIIGYSEMLTDRAKEGGQAEFVKDLEKVCVAGHGLLGIIERSFIVTPQQGAEAPHAKNGHAGDATARERSHHTQGVKADGHLLVVDDDEGNRDVLSQRLIKLGYTVEHAQDGREALEMLDSSTFDLVLLDIMMPEIDGYEVLRRMKSSDHLRHVPVIMVSALSEMESVARCIEMGAEDYLTKPFNAILLRARVGASLEKKRGRDREVLLFDELQANYQRLQELEGLRDDLTNMIVHDLRTPLTSIVAAIQTLDVVGTVNGAQREVLNIAVTGCGSLLSMINSLLDVEQFESGTMELDYTLLSLPELIESAVAQVAPLAQAKKLAVVKELALDLPWLEGDQNKLQRVLVNLLGNAVKFTPDGGSITIDVRPSADAQFVEFCVRDTGEGIPTEAFERIFQKFGQVHSLHGARPIGTGLGLTFCKFAVEAHGGQIDVVSSVGHGSSFCFTIPVSPAA